MQQEYSINGDEYRLPEGVPFKDVKAVMNERKLSLTFPSGKISLATEEEADEEEDA